MTEIGELKFGLSKMLPSEDELMRRLCLLCDDDINNIKNEREKLTYKIEKSTSTMRDYCNYIKFENDLLRMISKKSKTEDMPTIQFSITNKIKILYNKGLKYFPHDIRFWEQYIKFLKKNKFVVDISKAYKNMLMYHGDDPKLWLTAAAEEYDELHNIERVEELFLQGMARHPDSELLHINYFKMMLYKVSEMSPSEQALGMEGVVEIYKNCPNKVYSMQYCCELLDICNTFPEITIGIQKLIRDDMIKNRHNPELWHTLAQRELKSLNTFNLKEHLKISNNKIIVKSENNCMDDVSRNRLSNISTPKTRICFCFDVYMESVNQVKTEEMWSLFLNAMLELNQDLRTQPRLKCQKLKEAFCAAHEAGMTSETNYFEYIEFLRKFGHSSDKFIEEVMETATNRHSNSLKLWEQRMNYFITKEDEFNLIQVFDNAYKAIGDEAYPLCKLLLEFYYVRFDLAHEIKPLFEKICIQKSEKFLEFRVLYLEHVATEGSIEKIREVYNQLAKYSPPYLKLHESMAVFESQQLIPDISSWRQCYENSVNLFGKTQTDVWLNFLRFENEYGEPNNAGQLFERAKKNINPDLLDILICQYQSLESVTGKV